MLFEYSLIGGVLFASGGIFRSMALMFSRTNPVTGFLLVLVGAGLIYYASTLKETPLLASDFANSVYKVVGRFN